MSDIGFLKKKPKPTSKFNNRNLRFHSLIFKNWLQRFGDGFHIL